MKNFERIKGMSIEELAEVLMCPAEYDATFNKTNKCGGNCCKCTLEWLERECDAERTNKK